MRVSRPLVLLLIFGLYLTLRGYHSRDGDQAHRLPLLLHQQDPTLYAVDPFVKAFDTFNPHKGSLALLGLASRPLGISVGLFALFTLTFAGTCLGVDRLTRCVWPDRNGVGWLAVSLLLFAKAGNIGTNHLFEAMLLDRLMAFALGWTAIADMVENPPRSAWSAAAWIGLAGLIHPSLGFQFAANLAMCWLVWAMAGLCSRRSCVLGLFTLSLALIPTLLYFGGSSATLMQGMSVEEFRMVSVDLQSPQHMMPHLWRAPQWYAWVAYFVVAGVAWFSPSLDKVSQHEPTSGPKQRLLALIAVTLAWLLLAYIGIEQIHDLRLTIFQPFRMATLARGLAIVLISGHVYDLWQTRELIPRGRAVLLAAGLMGDRAMAVTACVEVVFALRLVQSDWLGVAAFAWGLFFLSLNDTESAHWPILAAIALTVVAHFTILRHSIDWTPRRLRLAMISAWAAPVLALLAPILPAKLADPLAFRWRFAAIPVDDIERLAVWCREHTSKDALFVGPPGPKTFRLWSERSLAFNRAGSPYHASGLADWAGRYRDHVGFVGSTSQFVKAYQSDRHGFESRYEAMSDQKLANLARRQGAEYVIATWQSRGPTDSANPLQLIHREGQYGVYQVVKSSS